METFLYYAGKALFENWLQKYTQHQRDKEEEMRELSEKHQEKMAKKNVVIREPEEENKSLASEVTSPEEENKLLEKKFTESQLATQEDEECEKLNKEIQKFHKEIDELKNAVAKESQIQKELQKVMEKKVSEMYIDFGSVYFNKERKPDDDDVLSPDIQYRKGAERSYKKTPGEDG